MENVRPAKGKRKQTKEAIFLRISKAPLVILTEINNTPLQCQIKNTTEATVQNFWCMVNSIAVLLYSRCHIFESRCV